MDYLQKFDDDFRGLFTKRLREIEDFGVELWSAMANVDWYHESDPNNLSRRYSHDSTTQKRKIPNRCTGF